ncbi:MAG: divalent metal cation transporter [Bacteroidota bacterium]
MRLGTSSLVVAAFIGPGTVLTCASAGVQFGYGLGWVLLFATAAAFVLQSFTASTGILAGQGLGEALREAADTPIRRALTFGLVVLGLWMGCAAFETGNLLGATAGLGLLLGLPEARWLPVVLAGLAMVLLLLDVRVLIRVLAGLVTLMGVLFLVTLLVAPLDLGEALRGAFVPAVPEGGLLTVVALIGTTIVTYNLFLHAAATRTYWHDTPSPQAWRRELLGMALFLPLGGLISWSILAAGASLADVDAPMTQVADFARLLEPVAGEAARYLFGLGLLAAGLTSAVTAPLAAAAGISELFGWSPEQDRGRYRLVWGSVVLTGLFFALTDFSPLRVIVAAQAANGLLLPLIAVFVVALAARQRAVSLPRWYLGLGGLIVLVSAGLGLRTLWWVWGQLSG